MTVIIDLTLLFILIGSAVLASVYVLSAACEEITCAFGSLDSPCDSRRKSRRAINPLPGEKNAQRRLY